MDRMADLVVGDSLLQLGALELCGICKQVRGPWTSTREQGIYEQECGCEQAAHRLEHAEDEDWEPDRWPRYDFNQVAELCRCCGLEVLESGSRWSEWFCEHCKDWIWDFNNLAGRCLIPIGRHSIMNGTWLPGDLAEDEEAVAEFVDESLSLFERMDWTEEWSRLVIERNLVACGLEPHEDLPLAEYLERADLLLPHPQKPPAVRAIFDAVPR